MKKILLSVLAALAGLGSARAADTATLYASNLGSGISAQGGATAVSQGTIRFGTFPAGFDFAANAENFPVLDAAFVQVHSVSGPINALSTNGFFDIEQVIATNVAYETIPYDSSAASTADVAGDLAGEKIYIWILNNTTASAATQQAIFSSNQTWPDKDLLVTDVTVSTDSGTSGLTAHLGVLGGGVNLGAGAPSHSMGGATEAPSTVVASRTPAGETVLVGTSVTFSYVAEGTPPFTQQWFKVGNATALGSGATFTIASPQLTDDGEYFVVVTNSAGSSPSNNVALDVITAIPTVEDQPDPVAVKAGGNATFTVLAKGAGTLSYKWLKGSASVPGATQPSLTLHGVALADSAAYRCEVSNVVAGKTNKVLSNPAQLTIVQDNVPPAAIAARASATASVTLTLAYAEAGIAAADKATLQWFKNGELIAGATSKTLKITPLTASPTAALYTCQVTAKNVALPVVGASTLLSVFDTAPEFAFAVPNTPAMPDGKVGRVYTYQIPVDPAANKAPASFDATGLPAGLVINKTTGLISGKPTKAGTNIKITLKLNSPLPQGNRTIQDTIDITGLPENIAGTYVGPVERINVLGAELGGKLDNVVVAATGVISGKLILGTGALPLVGSVTVDPNTNDVTASVTVKRLISQAPLTITFVLGGDLLTNGDITDGNAHVFFKGWRNKWLATPAPSSAARYVATYNIATGLDEGDVNDNNPHVPQGFGYASFPVKADGKLTFAGKFADGNGITGSTFVGPNGQVFLFQTLYGNKGSYLGDLVIADQGDADPKNNEITGDASWSCPVNTAAANKLYRDGFNFDLIIAGGAFTAPATNTLLGLAANDTADLVFEDANIETAPQNPDTTVTILAASKFTVGAVAAKTALSVAPATGIFSGSFEAVAKKKTAFNGLIVPIQGVQQGLGFFLLDQAGTPLTQRSGAVFFEKPVE